MVGMPLARLSFVLFLFLFHTFVFAFDARFQIDPAADLVQLERSGDITAKVVKSNGAYRSDASAVLNVNIHTLFAKSIDFDHFQQMGIPNVEQSKIVEYNGGDILYTWTQMSTAGRTSKHYLEVRIDRHLTRSGAMGVMWELSPKRASWPYVSDSAFDRLEGSWYVEPLPNGKVYVRYFLNGDVDTSLPSFLVDLVAKRQFKKGVEDIIRILAREAGARP
jgi:hypothetical protein